MTTLKQITRTWLYLSHATTRFKEFAKEEQFKQADRHLVNLIRIYKAYKRQVKAYRG